MVVGALYALAVFVIFLAQNGPVEAGVFGMVVVVTITLLSFAPLVTFLTGFRRASLVGTLALVALLAYYVGGLLLWFPVGAGVIASTIAGVPARKRGSSVAADHDRLDALH